MSDQERPTGQRFTQVYLDPSPASTDSIKLRNRVGEHFYAEHYSFGLKARSAILSELGCSMKSSTNVTHDVRVFFKECALHDFLDALTVVYWALPERNGNHLVTYPRSKWLHFVRRALKQTNVSFDLDDNGGVHPRVDTAFVAGRQAALSGLELSKHRAARDHFEESYAALNGAAPRTGHAIREMHLALETVFKQHFQSASRLDVAEINKLLKPRVFDMQSGPELEAAKLMLTSAGNFISAGHQFRHANGEPEPAPPSMDLTIWMLSQGTAFLRWLIAFVELDVD